MKKFIRRTINRWRDFQITITSNHEYDDEYGALWVRRSFLDECMSAEDIIDDMLNRLFYWVIEAYWWLNMLE